MALIGSLGAPPLLTPEKIIRYTHVTTQLTIGSRWLERLALTIKVVISLPLVGRESIMLFIIQFPLADSRHFLPAGDSPPQLGVPTWPLPAANKEFLRAFGPLKRRWRGGISGWLGEGVICEANNALSFKGADLFYEIDDHPEDSFEVERLQFWVAYKRFFADGLGMSKFEVGLVIDAQWLWNSVPPRHTIGLLNKILDLQVTIPDPATPGIHTCSLFEAGKYLAPLYLWSSSVLANYSPDEAASWWVTPCEPILCLTQDGGDEILTMPEGGYPVTFAGNVIGTLGHHLIAHHGQTFRLWNLIETATPEGEYSRQPRYYRSESQQKARQLRLYLLRLHAEKQCLLQVVRHVVRGNIAPERETPASDRLQRYFNETISHLARLRLHSATLSNLDIEDFARDLEENMTAGEYDAILRALERMGMRPNIYFKTKKEMGLHVDRSDLRRRLSDFLSLNEINTLCFDLNVDSENLSPLKDERIVGLLRYLENRGRLDELVGWLKENRRDVLE